MKTLHMRVLSSIALTAVLCCFAAVPAAQAAWRAPGAGRAAHAAPGRSQTVAYDDLSGVSAISPTDAWAVGLYHCYGCKVRTAVLQWNGTAWSPVTSPNPGPGANQLSGVSAVSPTDAWAAGSSCTAKCQTLSTLILHWNGTTWSRVNSPSPGGRGRDSLSSVSAVSVADAWAAGTECPGKCRALGTLILHWNGTAWSRVTSPSPGQGHDDVLNAVSAVSPSDAWAAGSYCPTSSCDPGDTLLLHWNGTAWSTVASPNSGSAQNELNAVSAIAPGDAWAVGDHCSNTVNLCHALILGWNGTHWTDVKSSGLGPYWTSLSGVTAISPADAWAVGTYCTRPTPCSGRPLILHWNGTAWSRVSTPGQPGDQLSGVAATAANNAWAVGGSLILHWNGRTWSN